MLVTSGTTSDLRHIQQREHIVVDRGDMSMLSCAASSTTHDAVGQ
jgi:hypothetical protein